MTNKKDIHPLEVMQRNSARAEQFLKQFANSHRLMILCNLTSGEKTVNELSKAVSLSQSALSQHLAKMRECGLVDADKRGKMVFYRISSLEAQALISTLYMIFCKD